MLKEEANKIKSSYEKHLWKCQYLETELKQEKDNYDKVKECVDFNAVENYELETSMHNKINELHKKITSIEERDK